MWKAADKKSFLDRLNKEGLLYEEFSLSRSKREIVVFESTGHTSRKIGEMVVEIENNPEYSEGMKNTLFTLYIPLMACSAGELPKTVDDFLWIKSEDIEDWVGRARKLNPKKFAMLDAQEKKLDLFLSEDAKAKKKKRRTTLSVSS